MMGTGIPRSLKQSGLWAPTSGTMNHGPCGLCDHDPACGTAGVTDKDSYTALCHADDHSCYHRWTVYKERPK